MSRGSSIARGRELPLRPVYDRLPATRRGPDRWQRWYRRSGEDFFAWGSLWNARPVRRASRGASRTVANRHSRALSGVIAYTILVQLVSFLFESSFEGTVLRVLFYLSIGLAVAEQIYRVGGMSR